MVLFSVIIPVYNRIDLLKEAIDSVLSQTFHDYEVIVVDDGSTDDVAAVVSSYGDRIYYLRQDNQGVGAARNTGATVAKGRYLAFLDSDDLWTPWTLETYAAVLKSKPNASFIAGTTYAFSTRDELSKFSMFGQAELDQDLTVVFEIFPNYYHCPEKRVGLVPSAVVINTQTFREQQGFIGRRGRIAEDADFWMKIGTIGEFILINSPTVCYYRKHVGNQMANALKTLPGALFIIQQEKTGQYPGGELHRRDRLQLLTKYVRPVSLSCLQQGHFSEAWQIYKQTFFWNLYLGRLRYLLGFMVMALRYGFKYRFLGYSHA